MNTLGKDSMFQILGVPVDRIMIHLNYRFTMCIRLNDLNKPVGLQSGVITCHDST